jgi:hypothetical protein
MKRRRELGSVRSHLEMTYATVENMFIRWGEVQHTPFKGYQMVDRECRCLANIELIKLILMKICLLRGD